MRVILFILLLLFPIRSVTGQMQSPLDRYIDLGLQKNLEIKQHSFSYQKSVRALAEARGMFLPSLDLQARYTRADGGRTIEIPIGDLMNPVYQSLNQILAAQGQQPAFPDSIDNEEISFLREEEHETKIELIQPLFHPSLYYNMKIKKEMSEVERADFERYARLLIKDIKTAYFTYLKTENVVELFEKTRDVLEENKRVSEKLYKNGKVTKDVVYRAEAELSLLEQQKAGAENNRNNARSYFNFLLNRPLNDPIEHLETTQLDCNQIIEAETVKIHALQEREEMKQLQRLLGIARFALNIKSASFYPSLTGVVDYGFQGEMYRFSDKDDFWMASLVLRWNLFRGFQDRSQRKQARLELDRVQLQLAELKNQIILQVQDALHNLEVARKSITSTRDRLKSSQQSFRIIKRKYEEGISPHIEFLDARNTVTNAEINHIIARYDYQIKYAEFEHVTASLDLSCYFRIEDIKPGQPASGFQIPNEGSKTGPFMEGSYNE